MQYGAWLEQHIGRYVDELSRFAAIPSVAGDADAIAVAAQFTADAFRRRGFHAEVIPSRGNPVVVATGGSGEASLLLYNHYDVQPAGRTEE
ncbi:MAG: peptidase M20, partial [Candidatus Eremiobacteraeota bacterium]|nr:peptidase M20 [Candidatus Eremiobacteraeota bacterium]